MVCLPRVYRHRPLEIRGGRDIGKKLLLHRLAIAAHREPRSCGIKTQRESPDSRSAQRRGTHERSSEPRSTTNSPRVPLSVTSQGTEIATMVDKMMMDEAPSNAGWTSTGVLQTEALEMFLAMYGSTDRCSSAPSP